MSYGVFMPIDFGIIFFLRQVSAAKLLSHSLLRLLLVFVCFVVFVSLFQGSWLIFDDWYVRVRRSVGMVKWQCPHFLPIDEYDYVPFVRSNLV